MQNKYPNSKRVTSFVLLPTSISPATLFPFSEAAMLSVCNVLFWRDFVDTQVKQIHTQLVPFPFGQ